MAEYSKPCCPHCSEKIEGEALIVKLVSNLDEFKGVLNETIVLANELQQALERLNNFQIKIQPKPL